MGRITPVERNTDVLRPYGVFACIAPFNFPLALSAGMSSAALAAGNAVVYKPAEDTPWTGLKLYEVYRDAGLPAGRVQPAGRPPGGDRRPALAAPRRRWRGVHRIQGGRDADPRRAERALDQAVPARAGRQERGDRACRSADLDAAAEGVMRSAFSLQNQKCSAT